MINDNQLNNESICVWCESRQVSTTIDFTLSKKQNTSTGFQILSRMIKVPVCDVCNKWYRKMSGKVLKRFLLLYIPTVIVGLICFGIFNQNPNTVQEVNAVKNTIALIGISSVLWGLIYLVISVVIVAFSPRAEGMKYKAITDIPFVKNETNDGWKLNAM